MCKKSFDKSSKFFLVTVMLCLVLFGCSSDTDNIEDISGSASANISAESDADNTEQAPSSDISSSDPSTSSDFSDSDSDSSDSGFYSASEDSESIILDSIPAYSGSPYVEINGNEPYFTESEITTTSYESYSGLDDLGRCGVAIACIGQDLMPAEDRGSISSVEPTGWHAITYDGIDGEYLYNRCHLIGWQLTGENANEKNLITGTRYLNMEGMLPFENMVADYILETDYHVMYRVTPIFEGNNLIASGVLMEALSVEDDGDGICYNVYCYNVQPGITIDYATGDSWEDDTVIAPEDSQEDNMVVASGDSWEDDTVITSEDIDDDEDTSDDSDSDSEVDYILNTNTMKFHYPNCSSVDLMSDKNKQEYTGSRDDLISQGYSPCKNCNP